MSPFPFFSRLRSSCFPFSSAVVLSLTAFAPTQAQSPMFNVAEYAEYNAKTAADVARRSGAAPSTTRRVQNTPNAPISTNIPVSTTRPADVASTPENARSTDAAKSQAARIWEAFLFGTPNRPVSTPKFAFAQRGAASPVRVERPTASAQTTRRTQPLQTAQSNQIARPTQSSQTTQSNQIARPAQSSQTTQSNQIARPAQLLQTTQSNQIARPAQPLQTAQNVAGPSDAELAAARRRRLQELNAILAARRPEEFSRRLALKNAAFAPPAPSPASADDAKINEYSENAESLAAGAPALPFLVAEPEADRADVALRNRAELARESVDAPFDAARANRPKIRQASNLEPAESSEPLPLVDDGLAAFLLPIRPNALRLSPNVFLSTDLVRLPEAAPLREASESAQTAQTTQNSQTMKNSQTPSNADSLQPARPLPNAPTSSTVATPLPAEPSTDVPTLRPTAQFVEPRFLPTRR